MGRGSISRRLFASLLAGALALVLICAGSAAAAPSFSAHGSVEQVYVTGLAPARAGVAARSAPGRRSPRSRPTPQGGLLFRDVTPGSGYRVRPRPERSRSR